MNLFYGRFARLSLLALPLLLTHCSFFNKGANVDTERLLAEDTKTGAVIAAWTPGNAIDIFPPDLRPPVPAGLDADTPGGFPVSIETVAQALMNGDPILDEATASVPANMPLPVQDTFARQFDLFNQAMQNFKDQGQPVPAQLPPRSDSGTQNLRRQIGGAWWPVCPRVCAYASAWAAASVCAMAQAQACATAANACGFVTVCAWAQSRFCAYAEGKAFAEVCAGG